MRTAQVLLLVAMGIGCGSNVNAAGVELVVALGRRAPRLDAHPAIDRTRAAARAVCGRQVPIRFELLGIRPESFAAERAVEELEGVASALELLASRPTSDPLREHVRETLAAIVVTHVHPPPPMREVHFGTEPAPRDSRERSADDRGVLRVFWAHVPQHPVPPTNGEADVLVELGRVHSIARARRFASALPTEVPPEALASYVAYLDDAGRHGFWTLERRAPHQVRAPGWRREVLERLLAVHERLERLRPSGAMPLRVQLDTSTFGLASQTLLDPPTAPWGELGGRLASFVRARWDSVGDVVRLRALFDVTSMGPEAAPPRREPYGIALQEWIALLTREMVRRTDAADQMLCPSDAPTCVRDRLARFVADHPSFGPPIVRDLAASPELLARFFGSALVVPRTPPRPTLAWVDLWRALDDDARVVAARAMVEASRATGHAPHDLEAGVAEIYPEATTEGRVELLRLLAQHTRSSESGPVIHAGATELGLLLRHPREGLDAFARVLRFAAEDLDVIAIVGAELERFLQGQGGEDDVRAWFRVLNATFLRFGVRGAKAFADFLRARPHIDERRLVVQRWLAALERV